MESSAQFDGIMMALRALGPPLALGLAGVLCASAWRKRGAHRLAAAGLALALVAGFVAGFAAVNHGRWSMPPAQALDWLPVLALMALALLITLEWTGGGLRAWVAAQAILLAFGIWRILPPALMEAGAAWVGALTVLWLGVWRWLDTMGGERREAGLAVGVSSAALAFVVALGGSITIGLAAASLMAALAALLLPALIGRAQALPRAVLGCAVLLYAWLTMAAFWYAEMPAWQLGLASGGLLTIGLRRPAQDAGAGSQPRALALGILVAAPLPLAAVAYGLWSMLHQSNVY